jgi:hypothetical protein
MLEITNKKGVESMKTETEAKLNKKCKGLFCEWRECLERQIALLGEIQRQPVHCEGCSMWVE